LLSILFGLGAALAWGAADFTGGLASRRTGAYRAALYGEFFGLVFIMIAAFFIHQPMPEWSSLGLAFAAGAIGTTGLLALFRAVIHGKMSIAMPVSALLTAILPVVVGSLLEGFPGGIIFFGFVLALAAIWLISQEEGKNSRFLARLSDLRLPLLAGIGFGAFFILMDIAAREATIWPMLASRAGGAIIVAVYMLFRQEPWRLEQGVWPVLILNAFLDVGGTAFYVLASQAGRLDVAAVISSLFPGTTVLLAALLLKERVSRSQGIGVLLALTAIAFLTL